MAMFIEITENEFTTQRHLCQKR